MTVKLTVIIFIIFIYLYLYWLIKMLFSTLLLTVLTIKITKTHFNQPIFTQVWVASSELKL